MHDDSAIVIPVMMLGGFSADASSDFSGMAQVLVRERMEERINDREREREREREKERRAVRGGGGGPDTAVSIIQGY